VTDRADFNARQHDRIVERIIGRPLTDEVRAELAAMDDDDRDTWPAWWRERVEAAEALWDAYG